MIPLHRLEALFDAAVDLSPEARAEFLATQAPEPEVRARVDALLAAHESAGALLPVSPEVAQDPGAAADRLAGQRLGGFTIRRCIAHGGMGIVYEAEQAHPRRRAAVKVLREGLGGRAAADRFHREIELLGRLEHPAIARLYDAGVEHTDDLRGDLPWFAMEFVDGRPLTAAADAASLDLDERLELLERVARGVAAAHQRGVIHRDLKPANVLVTPEGDPRIVDFGVARALDDGRGAHTTRGRLVGTVAYMSPEQLAGEPGAGDVRSDLYALGVMLYELITGRHPFPDDDTGGAIEARARPIADLPLDLGGRRRDLETLLRVALADHPDNRYASADALADDLARIRRDEAISVRAPGFAERAARAIRRHRVRSALVGLVLIVAVCGIGGVTWGFVRADHHRRAAERERDQLRSSLALIDRIVLAVDPSRLGRAATVAELLLEIEADVERDFPDAPLARSSLFQTLGTAHGFIGDLERGRALHRRALELRLTELGPDHPETAELVIHTRGGFDDARALELLPRARAILARDRAATDPLLFRAFTDEIRIRSRMGDRAGALTALSDWIDRHGEALTDEQRAILAMNESGLQFASGRFESALVAGRRAIEYLRDHPDRENRYLLGSRQAVVVALTALGRPAEAEADAAYLSATMCRILGAHHPAARSHVAIHAIVLLELGRWDEAAALVDAAGPPALPGADSPVTDPLVPVQGAIERSRSGDAAALPWVRPMLDAEEISFVKRMFGLRTLHAAARSLGQDDLADEAAAVHATLAPEWPPLAP